MSEKKVIQFDSTLLQAGNTNVAEAVETDDDLYFNETYVVIGARLSGNMIHATYDLTVIGDVEADTIEINGELTVNGNIKADKLRCRRLVCTGKVCVKELLCDEDSFSKSISTNILQTQGSFIVLDSLVVDEKCQAERNIITGEGLSGSGALVAENVIAGEYFDFDGGVSANIFEVETLFKQEKSYTELSVEDMDCLNRMDNALEKYFDELVSETNDELLDTLAESAEIQRVSFSEMYYLFCELTRISQMDVITNLRDYLVVQYAYSTFPIKLIEHKDISKAFTMVSDEVDIDSFMYSAESLMEFAYSLKILVSICTEDFDLIADKIFEFIGLRYSFVTKRFEGRLV